MKNYHIGDVLSVTTGRLVAQRHIGAVYDILNFLTGDDLYTHQIPRAMTECEPWLATQFPTLMKDAPEMQPHLERLTATLEGMTKETAPGLVAAWVESVREAFGLPEMLPVYEMGADMHPPIDPLEELRAMAPNKPVLSIVVGDDERV